MKSFVTSFVVLMVAGLALSAPTSKENDETLAVTAEFFLDSLAVYTAEHEIVGLTVPLNSLNFDEDDDEDDNNEATGTDSGLTIFFVEADIKENGERVDQGLYVLKEGKAKQLLPHGRDAAASNDDSKNVYFGASDGLYVYNEKENTAEKYGTLSDSIIGIAKENGTDIIFILTDNNEVYRVSDDGTVKTKIDKIENAKQIVLDYSSNLYYYNDKKEVYVYNGNDVKKIEGLPENPLSLNIIKPPFIIEDGVPVIIGKKSYVAYANGTSEVTDFEIEAAPSAYAMEATLIQYYAYNKKIYEYNILAIIFGDILDDLKSFLNDKKDSIESIATRSRSDLRGL